MGAEFGASYRPLRHNVASESRDITPLSGMCQRLQSKRREIQLIAERALRPEAKSHGTPRGSSPMLVKYVHSIRNKTGGDERKLNEILPPSTLERGVALSKKQRGDSLFLDDDRNGALQQSDRNDDMTFVFDTQEDSFHAR